MDGGRLRQHFPKTKSEEFMIEVYNVYDSEGVADVIVFASGTIENPNVDKIVKIDLIDDKDIETKRRMLYEIERRGIQQEVGELFRFYYKTDFIGEFRNKGISSTENRNSGRLDTKRRSSEVKANRIIEFHVDEDKGRNYDTVTFAIPVTVGNTTGYMAVVIREEGKKYFKLHRVFMPDGSLFEFTETKKSNAETAGLQNANVSPTNVASNSSIPQKSDLSTLDAKKVQKVAPNNSPTPLKTRRSQAYLSTSEADRSKFGFQR